MASNLVASLRHEATKQEMLRVTRCRKLWKLCSPSQQVQEGRDFGLDEHKCLLEPKDTRPPT